MPAPADDEPKISLLYVDDEPALLEIARLFLERTGAYVVSTCTNPHDALRIIPERSFDAILSDYQMPGMDGITFLRHLRSAGNTTPFIIFTGRGREEVVIEALNEGADFYLQKGGDPKSQFAELSNKIRYAVTRRRAEEAISESEKEYSLLFNQMNAGFAVHEIILDEHGTPADYRFINVNPAYEEMTGLSKERIIGRTVRTILPGTEDFWIEAFGDVALTGISRHFQDYSSELGRWYDVLAYSPGYGKFAVSLQDITERKRVEDALRASEAQKGAFLDGIDINIAYVTHDLEILWANKTAAASVKMEPEEVKERRCYEVWGDASGPCPNCPTVKAFRSMKSEQTIIHTPDGKYWDERAEPVFDAEGRMIGVIEIAQDITDQKAAEEALFLKSAAIDSSIHGIVIAGPDGILRYVNHTFLTASGYESPDEVLGRPASDFYISKEIAGQVLWETLNRGTWSGEIEGRRRDGSSLPLKLSTNLVRDTSGTPVAMMGSFVDITRQREADYDLAIAEKRLMEAHRLAHIGIWDWVRETDTMTWSEELYAIAGRDPALPAPNYRDHQPLYTPESWERLRPAIHSTFRTGKPFSLELEMVRPDGTIRIVHGLGHQSHDMNGNLIGLHGTVQDITERKQAEATLLENKERLNTILENIQDIVWSYDLDAKGRFLSSYISPAGSKVLGITEEELNHDFAVWFSYVLPEDLPKVQGTMADGIQQRSGRSMEYRIQRPDGSIRWILSSGDPIRHGDGSIRVIGTGRDITDRKAAEDAMHTINKKLQLLSSITRHDILNQIMVIRAYIDVTLPEVGDPELVTYLERSKKAVTAIQKQIGFTKVYEELGLHTPSWQQLPAIIKQTQDARLPIHHDCEGYAVYADPMFERVLYNLSDNTIRHAEGAEHIRIRCEERDGDLIIIQEDDGPGIPDDQKEEIFEKGVGRNTGFGLFLAREILAITGISIIETGICGKGARFEIRVPAGAWQNSREGKI
ncbi:PAS domain S-box-containing protein [Methanocalculus alkaliphilus]|uniref:response regulator n=1 Tax=Methanocalculus alkaliphilus TaxID=768730 RepID=UPI00209F2DF8|nr:response regulator [Methanocalculus alkaliphilus]MCP1715503.1 PAS domain S-box-containing protein [Methanocalculus alkaliphilus]